MVRRASGYKAERVVMAVLVVRLIHGTADLHRTLRDRARWIEQLAMPYITMPQTAATIKQGRRTNTTQCKRN